jgi:hypothetical protein
MPTPVRRRLPRAAAAALLALLVPTLGACGFNEQTDQVYQPAQGVNDRSGTVDVLGAVVVSGTDGSGTFVASLVNKSETKTHTLTGITGADGVQVSLTKPVEVGAGDLVDLAPMGAASVTGESIKAGGYVRLTLTFDNGQTAEINTPIVDRDGDYSGVAPAIPSSSPTS